MQVAVKAKAAHKPRKSVPFYYDREQMDARLAAAKTEGKPIPQDLKSSNDILEWLLAQ